MEQVKFDGDTDDEGTMVRVNASASPQFVNSLVLDGGLVLNTKPPLSKASSPSLVTFGYHPCAWPWLKGQAR